MKKTRIQINGESRQILLMIISSPLEAARVNDFLTIKGILPEDVYQ